MIDASPAPVGGIDSIPEPCCIVIEGEIVKANHTAAALLGAKAPDQLNGVRLSRLVTPEQRRVFSALVARAAAGGLVRPLEARFQRRDGSSFLGECAFAPAQWADAGATQVWIQEISDRKATIQAVREDNKRKEVFLASVAHELRNPLAPLRAALDVTLRCPEHDPRVVDALKIMDRQLNHLSAIVDDLVDVSRTSNGKLALAPKPTELSEVLNECAIATRQTFQERGHVLDLWVSPPPGHVVSGEFDRLVQVFTNLLLNAAKFTPVGGVIRVDIQHGGATEVVTVTDNGVGIAPGDLGRVFDPFDRLGKKGAEYPAGMGIGLAVAKQLVDLHGGRLEAKSDGPGKGSVFRVTLPRHKGNGAAALVPTLPQHEPASARDLPQRRILIADDDPDVAEALRLLLESLGHHAWVAHDGHEAISQALAVEPDLILLDLSMPDISGLEVARRLRATLNGDKIHIAALTGHCQPADHERTRKAGFEWHLVKPVTSQTLLDTLAKLPPHPDQHA